MEIGRGGTYVPARVALQGRIHRSFPVHDACILGMETPLCGRSGGHAGAAPTVSFGWITRGWLVVFGWIAHKWLFGLCGMRGKILRRWVVAAPMCPPVSSCKGATIIKYFHEK